MFTFGYIFFSFCGCITRKFRIESREREINNLPSLTLLSVCCCVCCCYCCCINKFKRRLRLALCPLSVSRFLLLHFRPTTSFTWERWGEWLLSARGDTGQVLGAAFVVFVIDAYALALSYTLADAQALLLVKLFSTIRQWIGALNQPQRTLAHRHRRLRLTVAGGLTLAEMYVCMFCIYMCVCMCGFHLPRQPFAAALYEGIHWLCVCWNCCG